MTSPPTATPTVRHRRAWLWAGALLVAAALSLAALRAVDRGDGPLLGPRSASLALRLRAGSAPIEGARAVLSGRDAAECDAESDADGNAELLDCPIGSGVLFVEVAGYVRVRRALRLEAGTNRADQQLTAAARLEGKVADDRAAPLAGAQVRVRVVDSPDDEVWAAESGPDGRFAIDTLPQAVVTLQVELAPYEDVTLPDLALPAREPLSIVLQRMAAVTGRVLGPDQQPLAAVPVSLAGSGIWPPRSAQSDAHGDFRFSAVPPGVYEVRAELGALVSAPLEGVAVEAGQDVRIELSLGQGRVLRGHVRDAASGKALAGARIRVAEDALSGTQKETQSKSDGTFELAGLRLLDQRVQVEAAGYVAIEARWSAGDPPLRAALLRGGRLRGRVEDERGRGVDSVDLEVVGQTSTGGTLHLRSNAPILSTASGQLRASAAAPLGALAGDNLGVTQGVVPPIPIVPGSGSGAALAAIPAFQSGPAGDFELSGIPPGEYRVLGRRPGYVVSATESFRLAAGGTVEDLRIVLGTGGRLVGTVIDGTRRPVSEIRVGVTQGDEATRWVVSDESGGFEFAALSGRCTVVAAPAVGAATQVEVNIPSGGVKRIDIIVESARGQLNGRIFDTGGEPVARALIKVDAGDARGQLPVSVLSKADGTFTIEGVPEPPFVVRVEHADYAPGVSARVTELGKSVQLVLEAGEVLEGSVLDAVSSEGLPGAKLTLQRGALVERVKSDREGKFAFQRIARGTYQLWAEAPGHLTLTRAIEVSGPQLRELELVLELAGSLSGEVVDRIGSPVWNAEVAAGAPPDWTRATRADHAGHFVLEGLAPGATTVSARKGGVTGLSGEVRVHEGVDSPGVVVRLGEVVRGDEEPEEEPARQQEAAAAQTAEGAVPLVLGRRGSQVVVERVAAGSSAERIGLQVGDVVSAINGELVRSPAQARGMLGLGSPRGWVIDVRRGSEVLRLRYLAGR